MGDLDVTSLCALVAAAKQDDKGSTALQEINAIARTVIDAKFANARADWLNVAK